MFDKFEYLTAVLYGTAHYYDFLTGKETKDPIYVVNYKTEEKWGAQITYQKEYTLNEMGQKGWELVAVTSDNSAIFKRKMLGGGGLVE